MSATEALRGSAVTGPHHDGSDLYVSDRPTDLGGDAVLRVRVPNGAADRVLLRCTIERRAADDRGGRRRAVGRRDVVACVASRSRHRSFATAGSSRAATRGTAGSTAAGSRAPRSRAGTTSHSSSIRAPRPGTHRRSCTRSIPDRFASSGAQYDPPEWAVPRPMGPAAGGARPEHVTRVVRGRSPRDRATPRPRREYRGERHLHDAVLPGRQHAPVRRVVIRPRRSSARRRRGACARSSVRRMHAA